MTQNEILTLFLEEVPAEHPKHMFCFFSANAARGNVLPFTQALLRTLADIDAVASGYAEEMLDRIASWSSLGASIRGERCHAGVPYARPDRVGNQISSTADRLPGMKSIACSCEGLPLIRDSGGAGSQVRPNGPPLAT
jgi:hypothetical protein